MYVRNTVIGSSLKFTFKNVILKAFFKNVSKRRNRLNQHNRNTTNPRMQGVRIPTFHNLKYVVNGEEDDEQ